MLYVERLGVGPWFLRGPFQPPAGVYRGSPTHATFEIGHAFSGGMMIELIRQHDTSPSVFNEKPAPERYGFHHWATLTARFDAELARYEALGYARAFSDTLPSGARVQYLDATPRPPRDDRAARMERRPGGGVRRVLAAVGRLGRKRPDPRD